MATMAQITTRDGYIIRAFSSMYVDYGLEITPPNGQDSFYSPCALSSESYGYNMCEHCYENMREFEECENPPTMEPIRMGRDVARRIRRSD